MSRDLHFSPLASTDARKIQRLQKRLFPRELTESLAEIRGILENTEEHLVCNLSFGLFEGQRMVGYFFAYVETESIFYGRSEEVIYLKEIALLPGFESWIRPMFFKLYEQWIAFAPGLPLEAHVLSDSLDNWKRLVRLSRYFGVTLTDTAEVSQPGRPPYRLLRLDVAPETVSLADQAAPLSDKGWTWGEDVTVKVVKDRRQWLSLKERWPELVAQTEDANVFQSFEYLWEWWKHYGFWNELRIYVIYRGEAIIGVAPFMLEFFPILGRTVRKLMFMTAPMDMNRPKLLFGRDAAVCRPALLAYLTEHRADWDVLDVDEQLAGPATGELEAHFRAARCLITRSETLCPYLALEGGWAAFLAGRSRRMRSNVNRLRRKIAELGSVSVERVTRWPELDAAVDLHCEVEEKSWKFETRLDLGGDRSRYFFHKALARVFGEAGKFQLRALRCGGRALATTYGIADNGVFQSLKIAHDAEYDRYSPGTVLESYELEDLFGSGLERYEFMGSFLANKLRWTSSVVETVNVHVYQRQPRLVLFYVVFFVLKRRVKALLKRTGQFERVDRLLNRLGKNPFPRY